MRRSTLLVAGLVGLVFADRAADAAPDAGTLDAGAPDAGTGCVATVDHPRPTLVAPVDGATGVPRNLVAAIHWNGADSCVAQPGCIDDSFRLLDATGATIPITLEVAPHQAGRVTAGVAAPVTVPIRLRPIDPLAPLADHVLVWRDRSVVPPAPKVLAVFTTGADLDTTPPRTTAAFLESTDLCQQYLDFACCDCTRGNGIIFNASAGEFGDLFDVALGDQVLASDAREIAYGMTDCGLGDIVAGPPDRSDIPWKTPPGPMTLTVTARDLAGNRSAPVEVSVTTDCAAFCYVPFPPGDDGGVLGGGGPPHDCSCHAGGAADLGGPSHLLVATLSGRTRRWRRPRSPAAPR